MLVAKNPKGPMFAGDTIQVCVHDAQCLRSPGRERWLVVLYTTGWHVAQHWWFATKREAEMKVTEVAEKEWGCRK